MLQTSTLGIFLILSSHLRLCFPDGMLLSGILINTTSFFPYACHMLRHLFDYRSDKLLAEQIMKLCEEWMNFRRFGHSRWLIFEILKSLTFRVMFENRYKRPPVAAVSYAPQKTPLFSCHCTENQLVLTLLAGRTCWGLCVIGPTPTKHVKLVWWDTGITKIQGLFRPQLIPWIRVLPEKLTVPQLLKKEIPPSL